MDGGFSSRAQVSHTTEEVAWTDGGAEYAGTAYTVTVEDPDLEQAAYTVHCRLPDPGKRYDLWVLSEDGWTKTDARLDGQYLLLESQTGTVTFCLTERAGPLAVVILAVGFAGLLIGFLLAHPLAAERHCGRTQTLTCGRVRRRQSTIWHALCRRMEMRSVCRFWGSPDPVPEKAWQAAMPFLPFMRRFAFRGWLCATPHGRTTAGDSPGNLCPGGLPPEEFRQNDDRRNRAAGACVGTGGKQAAPSAESSPGNGAASHPGPDSRGGTAAKSLVCMIEAVEILKVKRLCRTYC